MTKFFCLWIGVTVIFGSLDAALSYAAQSKVERILGKVTLVRGVSERALSEETPLKAGDLLITSAEGRAQWGGASATVELAPGSIFQVTAAGGKLLYGQFLARTKKTARLETPTSVIQMSAGSEGVVQILKSLKELGRRSSGQMDELPEWSTVKKLTESKDLLTQVSCLLGEIRLKPQRSEAVILKAGDVARIQGASGGFFPELSSIDQVRALVQSLGFRQ